ncbi:MAG: filament integrity protein fraC [Calothrix sp. C42_A2020_038]|nr:filament integrity protein fraC [Calothrix sp. C42_A2020_038]
MLDFLPFPSFYVSPVFPLGAILFNFLFFTITIPIEAYVLTRRLKFDKRTSIFYSITINLFSGAIGWVVFFIIEPFLPIEWKSAIISYVFFSQPMGNMNGLLLMSAVTIFFSTFLVKFILLKLALISMRDPGKVRPEAQIIGRKTSRRIGRMKLQNTSLLTTILISNSLSYSAITVVLIISTFRL